MHHKFNTCWSLAMYLLVITILSGGFSNGVEIQSDSTSEHMHMHRHMDESALVFFTLDELKLGRTLPIYFRGTNPSNSPKFVPREEAQLIPFSLSKFHFLLNYFGFSHASSQAKAMENTLRECEVKPIIGETKFCATSLESMLDFVHEMIGVTVQVRVLSTRKHQKSTDNVLRNYTIVDEPREIEATKMVACHTMPYPYVVYYCHYQKSESKVFQVSLQGETQHNHIDNKNGLDLVEAVAVCHMDTSQWSQTHVSFKLLGIKPGESPVCHFFPADNLVWVPLSKIHKGVIVSDHVSVM